MKKQNQVAVSTVQVISDEISLDVFNEIGKNSKTSEEIMQILGITRKQYYTIQIVLLNSSLIIRKGKLLALTSFGRLIFGAQRRLLQQFLTLGN